jgi:prepilin-type N-terminal cleavage/methylation domain-containing protein
MRHRRLSFTHKHQRGFTLIELLIAIAIVGLIAGGITAAISQVLTINTRSSNHMIAVRQVQQAGKEVSKDALQSQNVTYTENPDFLLTLIWTDWEGANNTVVYTLQPMPSSSGLKMLARNHTINGTMEATALPVVAQYIDPDPENTYCEFVGGVLTFKITATVGDQSETRIYEVEPRPDS